MTFPDQLRATRRHLGITQADLAARLKVTVQTVSNWECGRVEPWPKQQNEIAGLLIEWLAEKPCDRPKRGRILDRINGEPHD